MIFLSLCRIVLKEVVTIKINLSAQLIEKPDFTVAKNILIPNVEVISGIRELDDLLSGFKSGEITFIDGDSILISNIPNQICVNTYRMFHGNVVCIDGGMCADPYKISQYARKMEIDQRKLLEHVFISRAFTVYQLTTLIQERLEDIILRNKPQVLIVGRFPLLFFDSDVPSKEAQVLLRNNLHKIKELTTKYSLVTVFTNSGSSVLSNSRNIRNILFDGVDEVVLMKQNDLVTRVDAIKKGKSTTILNLSKEQLRLCDFGLVM
jgi:hypothetical protein